MRTILKNTIKTCKMATKKYSGIVGSNEQDIKELLISERMKGQSFRDIAKEIGFKFGVKVSHTTLSSYWKDKCNGETLDKQIEEIEGRVLMEAGSGSGIEIDTTEEMEVVNKKGVDGVIDEMLKEMAAMCLSNLKKHKAGEDRLRVELFKSLKDLQALKKNL